MKRIILPVVVLAIAVVVYLFAADHIDAPAVTDTSSDITDFYAFNGESGLVFVANVQGLLAPGEATSNASFDEDVMIEINIDNNEDNVEDLVIQCLFEGGQVMVYGPVAPTETGTKSVIETEGALTSTAITSVDDDEISVGTNEGISVFAGPRDDPFFFDFEQFNKILAGDTTAFRDPGVDTFAGTNVLSVVVEVPKEMLGGSGTLNTWVETKRKM